MKKGWTWQAGIWAGLMMGLLVNGAEAQQQPSQPSRVSQQQLEQASASSDALIESANHVAQLIDDDRAVDAWNAAAPFMFARLGSSEFAATARSARQGFAKVTVRNWQSVRRALRVDNGDVPTGMYGTVEFSTRLADFTMIVELVTFRLEADGQWRLVGYAPRRAP